MARQTRLFALTSLAAVALGATACQPAAEAPAAEAGGSDTTHTIIETREVAVPPVVIERPSPDIVIERAPPAGDTTTVRAGQNGIEVETTNR